MGIWNDCTGVPVAPLHLRYHFKRFQELFTRQVPFNEFQGPSVIFKILCGSPDRPSDENTCSRMTPSWWNILTSCLKFIAQQRPTIMTVVNEIAKIVCPHVIARFPVIYRALNQMTGTGFPGTREVGIQF